MALHLKLSTVLVSMLVLSVLAPIEMSEATNPFSLHKLKDFLKSTIQLASSQNHHHHQGAQHGRYQQHSHQQEQQQHQNHRAMATAEGKHLSNLIRKELEDILEARLQEIHSENNTRDNGTFEYDEASNNDTDYYDTGNTTTSYNTTPGPEDGTKPEEKSKDSDKEWEGSKSDSSSGRRKARKEGGRPCYHDFDSRPVPAGIWRKYYEYGQRGGHATTSTEMPTTEANPVTERETTESAFMPTVASEPEESHVQVVTQPEYYTANLMTPKNIRIVYIHINPREACIYTLDDAHIQLCTNGNTYVRSLSDCTSDEKGYIIVCDTTVEDEVCYLQASLQTNICL